MGKAQGKKKSVAQKSPKKGTAGKKYAKLPLWAKLRVAYGMATKEELSSFDKLVSPIIERNEKKHGAVKLTCKPGTSCLFTCLQSSCTSSCTSGCTSSCTKSCTRSCTSNCTDTCLGMPGCMGSVGIVKSR